MKGRPKKGAAKGSLGFAVSPKPGWQPWWPDGQRVAIKSVLRKAKPSGPRAPSKRQLRHEARNAQLHREALQRKADLRDKREAETAVTKQTKAEFQARLRAFPTRAEQFLCQHLDHLGIPYEFQPIISGYIPDFQFGSLLVELDGPIHDTQQDYDRRRDAHLSKKGFTVVRFTNNDLFEAPLRVLSAIQKALA